MNPNKALWEKRRLHTHCGEHARERRGTGQEHRRHEGTQGVGSRLRRRQPQRRLPSATLGADVLGIDIATNLVAAGSARAKAAGLANCTFQEGDALQSRGAERR